MMISIYNSIRTFNDNRYLQSVSIYSTFCQRLQNPAIYLLANHHDHLNFLVSGRGLACQQEISLALVKAPPIHY